ncbi:uncharacterized protein LOC126970425 [Leptidea sinapis]|uniref:Tetraspanin n=1 Tax=Leptidea sinapis TaxID=189913 RepID=A0A5E4R7M0_9NEOP|nr:uncharacterized protein LOC126970425 [Leptidea sinapis]VVD05946.1 unnamed protein product [Leptidea sinapis]
MEMKTSGLVLFVCAGLLLSGGVILSVSTAWNIFRMSYYFWTTDLGVELGSSVLIISGGLLCLPVCWLATLVPSYPKSVPILSTLMLSVTAALIVLSAGLSSMVDLSRAVRDPSGLNASMMRAMSMEALDPAVKGAFAAMQIELKCCGVESHGDWYNYRQTLPPACCGRIWTGKIGDHCDKRTYMPGCLRRTLDELRSFVNSLSMLCCALIIVMAVTLFATTYTLVSNVVDITNKSQQSLRIAYLSGNILQPNPTTSTNVFSPPSTLLNPPPNNPTANFYPSLQTPYNQG